MDGLPQTTPARIGGAVPLNPPAELELSIERCVKTATGFYISVDGNSSEAQPAIGDVRVKFTVVKPHDISICAVQQGDTFVSYVAKNGKTVNLQTDGVKSADEMFTSAQNANKMLTWLLRIVGFAMMYIGIGMILKPLSVLGDVLPFLGNLIGMGASLVAFLVALPCSLVVIAIAWIVYRPVLGVILIVVVVGLIVAFRSLYAKVKAAKQPEQPAA